MSIFFMFWEHLHRTMIHQITLVTIRSYKAKLIILVQYGHNRRNGKNWNHLLNRNNWVIGIEIYFLDSQNRFLSSALNNILFRCFFFIFTPWCIERMFILLTRLFPMLSDQNKMMKIIWGPSMNHSFNP
jgi:hypothetical protein